MARGQHTHDIPSQGNSSKVKLTAGLLSDNVPTSFSKMEWCFQENKDYASMHRKQSPNWGQEMQHTHDGGQDNSKSESRSEEEAGVQRSMNRTEDEEERPQPRKKQGFAIQIKNNEPIIFDDDSVSTLTYHDRRSSRRESCDLSDMLGPFQKVSTSRIFAAEVAANRIQEGEPVVYNAPTDAEQLEEDFDEKKLNPALSRQQKLCRAKQRFHGKIKESPSQESAATSIRSTRSESIAQRVAMFEKPNIKNSSPPVTQPIQVKKNDFSATPVDHQTDLLTPEPAKPSSKRTPFKTCLKSGTSDRSSRSIASILKTGTLDKSEKSTRSVTFMDEETDLESHRDSTIHDIPASESNLSASECKRSLSLKYKKSRIAKEKRKLKHLSLQTGDKNESSKSGVDFFAGCPFEFDFNFGLDNFDLDNFEFRRFDLSMLLRAFDCFGRDKRYDLVSSAAMG